MSQRLCIAAIKDKYSNLTAKEKLAADFILQNPERGISMSIAELAENSGVVKSVIVRLCRSLGYSGYAEFKLLLSKEPVRNEQLGFFPNITRDDTPESILNKVFAANIKTLYGPLSSINRETLSAVVDLLQGANRIYIYGIGTSAGIVCDFQYRLMQLGYTAFCFQDIAIIKVSTLNITEGDVGIGISNSGRTIATVDALKLAREKGAKTVCLTSFSGCEIIKHSDFPLVVYTDEINYPIEAISARLAHISVLNVIAIALSSKNFGQTIKRMAQTHDLINTVRY